jgi:hypothetical protein
MRCTQFQVIASLLSEERLLEEFKQVATLYRNLVDTDTIYSARGLMRECEETYFDCLHQLVEKEL